MPDVDGQLVGIAQLVLQMIDIPIAAKITDSFNPHGVSLEAPSFERVFRFLKQCFIIGKWSPECHIIAIALVVRLINSTAQQLTKDNWTYLIFIGLLLAQKTWDDIPLTNQEFSVLWHSVCVHTNNTVLPCRILLNLVNRMEEAFLGMIYFDCFVSRRTYFLFFFELRDKVQEISPRPRRPLTMQGAAQFNAGFRTLSRPPALLPRQHADAPLCQFARGRAVLS